LANIKRQIKKIAFPETNFYFIPCGEIPADPSEILTNKNLSKVLTILKREYDVIIIDSPPTLPVGDSLLVGKCVDGVILLAKAGQVRKKQLMNTISFHENLGSNVFGICLNMAPLIDRAQEYGYQSSKHVYDSSYSYKNYYKAKSQAPYAPLDSEGGAKRSISQIIREIKQN